MELWAKDAIELLGPGTLIFEDEAFGEFRFIAVRGWMDCRFGDRNGKPLVDSVPSLPARLRTRKPLRARRALPPAERSHGMVESVDSSSKAIE